MSEKQIELRSWERKFLKLIRQAKMKTVKEHTKEDACIRRK